MRPGWEDVGPNKYDNFLRRYVGHNCTLFYWDAPHGWTASTPYGYVWTLFDDDRQHLAEAAADAMRVCEEVARTGQPPLGAWS